MSIRGLFLGLRIELRHSPMLTVLPMLIFLYAVVAWDAIAPGPPMWWNTTAAVVGSGMLASPVAAGVAAWSATRGRRRRTSYLAALAGRSSLMIVATEVAAACVWSVAGYVAVASILIGRASIHPSWGGPDLLWMSAGALGCGSTAVVGYTVGRLVGRIWVSPLVTIAGYLLIAWNIRHQNAPWHLLAPVVVVDPTVFQQVNHVVVLGQILWVLGVCSTLVVGLAVVASARLRAGVAAATVLTTVLTVLGAAAVVRHHDQLLVNTENPPYVCRGASPPVCVHPSFADGLAALVESYGNLDAKLAGTPAQIRKLEQRPRGRYGAPSAGATAFSLDDLSRGFAERSVEETVTRLIACPPTRAIDKDILSEILLLRTWLAGNIDLLDESELTNSHVRWFVTIDDRARASWFAQNYEIVHSCQVTWDDFR